MIFNNGFNEAGRRRRQDMILKRILFFISLRAVVAAQNIAPSVSNVAYGPYARNSLDLWISEGETPRPLLIYIHGGAWTSNDKNQIYGRVPISDWLAKGVSVASIDYRYSTDAILPAPVYDAVRAIQFLRYKAKEYNIDPSKIVLQGGSAGGCSALWILFHDDMADPQSEDPVLRESSRVQGACVQSAQTSIDPVLLKKWIGASAAGHGMIFRAAGASSYSDLMQHYEKYKPLLDEFSPIHHMDADDPPVFLSYSADLSLPCPEPAKAIHHGMFGIELKKKADQIGYHRCFLDIPGYSRSDNGSNSAQFIESILKP
jgi:hypothetical protein